MKKEKLEEVLKQLNDLQKKRYELIDGRISVEEYQNKSLPLLAQQFGLIDFAHYMKLDVWLANDRRWYGVILDD